MLYDDITQEVRDRKIIDSLTFSENCVAATCYTARVGNEAYVSSNHTKRTIDEKNPLVVNPGEFFLLTTFEKFKIPNDILCQIGFKSTLTRKGIVPLAGKTIDPGFEGVLVIGFFNSSPRKHFIHLKDDLCKIEFLKLHKQVEDKYCVKSYAGQDAGHIPKQDMDNLLSYKAASLSDIAERLKTLEIHNKLIIGGGVVLLISLVFSEWIKHFLK
jgi:deoxycytidine triphosphate deaminase